MTRPYTLAAATSPFALAADPLTGLIALAQLPIQNVIVPTNYAIANLGGALSKLSAAP